MRISIRMRVGWSGGNVKRGGLSVRRGMVSVGGGLRPQAEPGYFVICD